MRFSVAKRAIADFKALSPSPLLLADLLLVLPEVATEFTRDFGDMWEQYYISGANNSHSEEYYYPVPVSRIEMISLMNFFW